MTSAMSCGCARENAAFPIFRSRVGAFQIFTARVGEGRGVPGEAGAGRRRRRAQRVERIVGEYLMMMAGTDPRSPNVIATNARWAKVAKHALALNAAIEEMKSLDELGLLLLQTAVSGNRKKPHVDYLIWESQCAKVARLAARQASQRSQKIERWQPVARRLGLLAVCTPVGVLGRLRWARRQGRQKPVDAIRRGRGFQGSCQDRSCREAATRDCRFCQKTVELGAWPLCVSGLVRSEGIVELERRIKPSNCTE